MDDFFISVAAREDGPSTCTNPQRVLVTLRVCPRSQLRTFNRVENFGASRRHCSSNLKLSAYLRIHYSMHAYDRPPNLVLGGASGGPACGRYYVTEKVVAHPGLCQLKKGLGFLSSVLCFGFGKK